MLQNEAGRFSVGGCATALALALYIGFIAYSIVWLPKRQRIGEAEKLVNGVWTRAMVYYTAEHHRLEDALRPKTFPIGSAPFEPGPDCYCQQGASCPGNDPIWNTDPLWRRLGFSIIESHHFKVSYEGEADRFIVRVRGDVGCNGVLSEFKRAGDQRAIGAPHLFKVQRKNEGE